MQPLTEEPITPRNGLRTGFEMKRGNVPGETALQVYFDGNCPICRREADMYQRVDRHRAINWIDLTGLADKKLPDGKTREEMLRIFHVRRMDGRWAIGVDAFAEIWGRLPYLRHFAFLFRLPVLRQMAEAAYRIFLAWQRFDRKRRARR